MNMLRIGTWRSADSVDLVACGWRDSGPGHLETGIKLIFAIDGRVPDFPGLRTGTRVARGAEEIAGQLFRGMDVVLIEPGSCPAAPVVAAGMWHYGWTLGDLGALAGATVAGLALAAQPGPCAVEICRDGRSSLDGHVTAAAVRARLADRFSGGRYHTPEVTVPLESVRLSQEAPSRVLIAPCAGTR
ncbi:acyclic terpene utilization AtuA family protein [Nonomuraea sp. SYSU D8015]|uniref:acyclic terpene utilization AtuA family protein n=1 Tax=Nonomuraea sp. SYSU D8015 TaxID=2593644 RepID=UPI001660DFFC|nr:acyclic terpene utilization AtuA family protein [Nonomuraea sp. SYSU D8015]